MNFKINNRTWSIKELPSEEILKKYNEELGEATYCFGLTNYPTQTIYLNHDIHTDVKKQTLYHELMHCYIWSYCYMNGEYNEEVVCNLVANSLDVIHEIAAKYFNSK